MATKELMLNYLQNQGFRPEVTDFGLAFLYEGKQFLFIYSEDDNEFFQLALPGIFEMDDDNQLAVYKAMDVTNSAQKVIKCTRFSGNTVWVFFEILIDSTPEFDDIVPRALNMLKSAQYKFYEVLQNG